MTRAIAIGALALAALASACDGAKAPPAVAESLLPDSADQVMFGLRHQMTSSGIRRAELRADTAYFYDQGNRIELRRVHVTFYTALGAKDAVLTGREGTYDVRAQRLVGRGDVVVVSEDGKRLASPQLIYDRASNQVSSDSSFTFNEPGRRLAGVGFRSDPGLRNLQVLRGAKSETTLQPAPGGGAGLRLPAGGARP